MRQHFSVSPEIWTPDYFIGFWETYGFLAYKVLGNAMNRCFSTKCCFDKGHSSVAIVIVLWLLRRRRQRWWGKSFLGFNLILLTSCTEENSVVEIIFLLQLLFFSFGYHSGRFSYFFESPKRPRKNVKDDAKLNAREYIWIYLRDILENAPSLPSYACNIPKINLALEWTTSNCPPLQTIWWNGFVGKLFLYAASISYNIRGEVIRDLLFRLVH